MPKGLACEVQSNSWKWPALFQWLQQVLVPTLVCCDANQLQPAAEVYHVQEIIDITLHLPVWSSKAPT